MFPRSLNTSLRPHLGLYKIALPRHNLSLVLLSFFQSPFLLALCLPSAYLPSCRTSSLTSHYLLYSINSSLPSSIPDILLIFLHPSNTSVRRSHSATLGLCFPLCLPHIMLSCKLLPNSIVVLLHRAFIMSSGLPCYPYTPPYMGLLWLPSLLPKLLAIPRTSLHPCLSLRHHFPAFLPH